MSSFQTILAGLRDVSERVLQELSTLTVTVSGVVSALDKAKADKVTLTAFTIPTTGWELRLSILCGSSCLWSDGE